MLKKLKIRIESTITDLDGTGLPEGESEKSVSETEATYRYSEGDIRIRYKEESEGNVSETEIVCREGWVTVKREGAIVSNLYFKEGESQKSIYSIPPYNFDAEVLAKRVRVSLNEDGGNISLIYNMKIGGADKSAVMKIWISKDLSQV